MSQSDKILNIANVFLKLSSGAADSMTHEEITSWIKALLEGSGAKIEVDTLDKDMVSLYISEFYTAGKEIAQIEREVDNHGWFIFNNLDNQIMEGYDELYLILHPIRGKQIDITGKVYHITRTKLVDNIMRNGLKPYKGRKVHGFKFPPRIFVSKNPDILADMDLGYKEGEDLTILEIDASELKNVPFFYDSQFPGDDWRSAFTTDPIPPSAIRVMQ